jgi:hypothetical protein
MHQQDDAALRPDRRLFDDMKEAPAGVENNTHGGKPRLDLACPPVGEKKESADKAEQRRQNRTDSVHHISRRPAAANLSKALPFGRRCQPIHRGAKRGKLRRDFKGAAIGA